jgi:hypothetical protein
VALGQVFSENFGFSPANLHSICFSTIIFTITRGWHNRPGVAAVPIASQTKIKKRNKKNYFYLAILFHSAYSREQAFTFPIPPDTLFIIRN